MDSGNESYDGPRFTLNYEDLMQHGIFDHERNLQVFTGLPSADVANTLLSAINVAYNLG